MGGVWSTKEAPPRWNRFFPDPKTALQPLTEMHLPMFKNEECHTEADPWPPISMLLEAAATKQSSRPDHPYQKPIRVHNTEIWRDYNVSPSSLKHCPIVVQSVQAPSARTFPKPGNGGQFQFCGREINKEWAFTQMEVMAGQNVEIIGSRLATQTLSNTAHQYKNVCFHQ